MILSNYITFLFLSILTIGFLLPENIKACCQVCPEDFYDELSFLEEISVQDKQKDNNFYWWRFLRPPSKSL